MSILTPHEATKHEGNKERELRLARSRSRASNSGARQDDCGSPRRSRVPRDLRPEDTRRLERVVVVQTRERPAVRANLTARRTNVLFVLLTPQSRLTFSAPYVSSASRAATLSKHTSNAAHAVPAMK